MADNMKYLLDKARNIAKRRSEGSNAESPIKVKRVQTMSLVHFMPEQGLQVAMLFKGKDFENFHKWINVKAPEILNKYSGLGVASNGHKLSYGKKEDNYVSKWIWNTEPKDEAATMLAIVVELIREKDVEISVQNQTVENYLQEAEIVFVVKALPKELDTDKIYPVVTVQFDVKQDKYGVLFLQNVYIHKETLKHYGFAYEEVAAAGETKRAWGKSYTRPRECQSMMCVLQNEMGMPNICILIDEDNCTHKQLYQIWRTCYQMSLFNANIEVPVNSMAETIYTMTDRKATDNMSAWMTAKAVTSSTAVITCSGEDFLKKSVDVHAEEYILFRLFLEFIF